MLPEPQLDTWGHHVDIWKWVDEEQQQLLTEEPAFSRQLRELPGLVTAGENSRVDAVVPGMLATARRLQHPWLEVFVRHWWMQSMVLHRRNAREGMREAVDLFERAHRDDTKDCPQSVCTTQDLCSAYGILDGPGFATERTTTADETLARIDRDWPCWSCVMEEKLSAMNHAGLHDAVLELGHAERRQQLSRQPREYANEFVDTRWVALTALGRHEEALEALNVPVKEWKGRTHANNHRVYRALTLAHLGRFEESLDALPSRAELGSDAEVLVEYHEAELLLIAADHLEWDRDRIAAQIGDVRTLASRDSRFDTARLAIRVAGFMIDRGSRTLARAVLDLAQESVAALLASPELQHQHAELMARTEAFTPDFPWSTPEEFAAQPDAVRMDQSGEALRRWPELLAVRLGLAHALSGYGLHAEALALLEAGHTEDPNPQLLDQLAATHVRAGRYAEAVAVFDGLPDDPHWRVSRIWWGTFGTVARGDAAGAGSSLMELLEREPENCGPGVSQRAAQLLTQAGDHARAVDAWKAYADRAEQPSSAHWDRMTAAALAGRWDAVRESAAANELEVPGDDGPIDEDFGWVRIDTGDQRLFAVRRSPVTARIMTVTGPSGDVENYGRLAAFDASPLEQPEGPDDPPILFPLAGWMEAPTHWSADLDGVRPDDDMWQSWVERAAAGGLTLRLAAGPDYRLPPTEPDGEPLRGLYAFLAIPNGFDNPSVVALLEELAADVDGHLFWIRLALAMGDTRTADDHRRRATALGIGDLP